MGSGSARGCHGADGSLEEGGREGPLWWVRCGVGWGVEVTQDMSQERGRWDESGWEIEMEMEGAWRKSREEGAGHCNLLGKPGRHPSPSLKLLKASEHLANCSSPRDANEINSAKCSSGHLQRARCQASVWSNPILLLLLSSSCPFLMILHPSFSRGSSAGTPHL